MIWSFDGYQAS